MPNAQQKIIKSVKFRLLPSKTEANKLWQHASASRFVWNAGVDYLQGRFESGLKHVSFMTKEEGLAAFFVQLKNDAEYSWLKELSSNSIRHSLKRLDDAYQAAFRRLKNSGEAGFPKFHKWESEGSFTAPTSDKFSIGKNGLRLEKIGWVRMRPRRGFQQCEIEGKSKMAIIKRENGKWFVFIQCEIIIDTPIHTGGKVGVDMGVAQTIILDDKKVYKKPTAKKLEARRRRYQKIMTRRRESALRKVAGWDGESETRKTAEQSLGKIHKAKMEAEKNYQLPRYSKQYEIAKTRCAKTTRNLMNIRHNFCHQISSEITRDYGFITIENLQIKNMTSAKKTTESGKNVVQKSELNKSILEQGWGIAADMLEYKARWRGGKVERVNPQNTGRTCPKCGQAAKKNRKIQKKFLCMKCGHSDNADVNAVRNIKVLAKGDMATVSGDGDISRSMKLKPPTSQRCLLGDTAGKKPGNLDGVKTPLRSG